MSNINNLDLNGPLDVDPSEITSGEMYKCKGKGTSIYLFLIGEEGGNNFVVINEDTNAISYATKTECQANYENFQLVTGFVNISL